MKQEEQLIRQIIEFLDSPDQMDCPHAREMAAQYAALCRDLNTRLEQCEAYLRQQMFLEAINFAEMEPAVMIYAESLDFSRRVEWMELCLAYDWPRPPVLRIEIVDKLNKAYRESAGLKPLLDKYRKISRAGSEQDKILLLRKIINLDPDNSNWLESLLEFEKKYIGSLIDSARMAIEKADFSSLASIFKELKNPELRVKPDEKVIKKITQLLEAQHQKMLRERADRMLEKIADAYSSFNFFELKLLIARWGHLCAERFTPNDNDLRQINEARSWLDDQQRERDAELRFNDILVELELALDNNAAIEILNAIYLKLTVFDKLVPENLERIYLTRKEEADLASRRKHLAKMALTICSVVGAFVLIILSILWHNREKSTRDWSARIDQAISARNLESAGKLIKELRLNEPGIAAKPQLLELENRFNAAQKEEDGKLMRLKAIMQEINTSIAQRYADNLDIAVRITEARQLVINNDDKLELNRIIAAKEKLDGEQQAERDSAFEKSMSELAQLRDKMNQYQSDEQVEQYGKILNEYRVLYAGAKAMQRVSPPLFADIERVKSELKLLEENYSATLQLYNKKNVILTAMRQQSLTLEKYRDLLKEYIANLPSDNRTPRFKTILKTVTDGIFVEKIKDFDPNELTKTQAEDYKRELEAVNPEDNIFRNDMLSCVNSFIDITQKANDLKQKIETINDNKRMAKMYGIVYKDYSNLTRELYTDAEFKWKRSKAGDETFYKTDFEPCKSPISTDTQGKYYIKETVQKNNDTGNISTKWEVNQDGFTDKRQENKSEACTLLTPRHDPQLSPHSLFIRNLYDQRHECTAYKEQFCARMIAELQNNDSKNPYSSMNPYLKLQFIQIFVTFLKETDGVGNDNFKSTAGNIDKCLQAYPQDFNWMVLLPSDREFMEKAINRVKVDNPIKCSIFQRDLQALSLSRKLYHCGYLEKKGNKYLIRNKSKLKDGEIWILNYKYGSWKFTIIGKCANGVLEIFPEYNPLLIEDMILFSPADGKKTEALSSEILKKSVDCAGIGIKWPDCWPENMRK